MTPQTLASESLEYRWFPIRAEHPDGTVETITGYTVEIGFTDNRLSTVGPTTWTAATWDSTLTRGGDTWQLARILIGPAGSATLRTVSAAVVERIIRRHSAAPT